MKTILVIGAGKSSSYLIQYLAEWCHVQHSRLIVAEMNQDALNRILLLTNNPVQLELINNVKDERTAQLIQQADVVISLLPVAFHADVARWCLWHAKHLLTASYVTTEIQGFHEEAKSKKLTFLFECGLDPGIDHMSALELIHRVQQTGQKIISFSSSTGGLLDPASPFDNPWHYKISWNARNVILAGKDGALFKENGKEEYVNYAHLFTWSKPLSWKGNVALEYYPNRDSLAYQKLYDLMEVESFIRGTIRRKGFGKAWAVLVHLGLTDDEKEVGVFDTYSDFLNFYFKSKDLLLYDDVDVQERLRFLYSQPRTKFVRVNKTAAQYLQELLEVLWKLEPQENDWVIMQHELKTTSQIYTSTLSVIGENNVLTAMSKTVGLPLAIAATKVLTGEYVCPGVSIPTQPKLYQAILKELEKNGIQFEEHVV